VLTRSTVPTVRAAIVAGLRARPGTAGAQVTPTLPGKTTKAQCVFLGTARGTDRPPVSRAGRVKREERYSLDVWVQVIHPGSDGVAAEERAYALFGELEDLLAEDARIGLGDTLVKATIGEWEQDLGPAEGSTGAWCCLLRIEVDVVARLN
jgi:hypothetical protein